MGRRRGGRPWWGSAIQGLERAGMEGREEVAPAAESAVSQSIRAGTREAEEPDGAGSTPVGRRTQREERRHLERLLSPPPPTVLAASDLHLAEGRDPETGVFDPRENFFAAGPFRRWLEHHADEAAGTALVLNGDIFDFLRVTEVPSDDGDYVRWRERLRALGEEERARSLPRPIPDNERTFGLRTHDFRTVWKLLVIRRGHPAFFEGLAGWLAEGGRLVISAGNHDPELYWPLVRQAIRDQLVRDGAPARAADERVAFAHEPFQVGNLHVEHGHQHESMTRIDGPPVLAFDPTQIRLPPGSFVNRYFINKIERLDPFIDNVKPVQDALMELLRRRPLRVLFLYVRATKFIRRALAIPRMISRAWAVVALGALGVPILTLSLTAAALISPGFRDQLFAVVPWIRSPGMQLAGGAGGTLFPALLPYLVSGGKEVLRTLGLIGDEDPLEAGAAEALRETFGGTEDDERSDRIYAVMGHTHRQTASRLGRLAGAEALYVNTGTWIPLWPQDREDLKGEIIYSFARFDRTGGSGYEHASYEWDDAAGEPRPARMLASK